MSSVISGCGALNKSDGTDRLLAFDSTGDCYIYDPTYTPVWRRQWLGMSPNMNFETESFMDKLWVVNGLTDNPRSYDGIYSDLNSWSSVVGSNFIPRAKYIKGYGDRLYLFNIWLTNGGAFPSRVWMSNKPVNNNITWGLETGSNLATTAASTTVTSAGALFQTRKIQVGDAFFITAGNNAGEYEVASVDSETQIKLTTAITNTGSGQSYWVGGNWFDVARDNSDVGMGMGKNSDRLLLFKRFSLWKFAKGTDAAGDSLIEIKGVPGTTSHRSIVNIRDWTFYFADTGVWRCNGTTSQLMSNAIQEIIDGMTAANKLLVVGWPVDDRVMKMFVGDINNSDTGLVIQNCVICYDAFSSTWWVEEYDDVIKCSTRFVYNDALGNYIFTNEGKIFQSETGNSYNGNPFPMEVETYFYFPIAPEVEVNFTRFRSYTEHGRELSCLYKLAYFDGRIDEDWRRLKPKYKTEHEQEWQLDQDENRASGYALKFIENSSSNARPVIERIAAYYTGGEIR